MNNDQVKQIIDGIGAMIEIWVITYKKLISMGMSAVDALSHTKEFMSVVTQDLMRSTSNGEEQHDKT